MDCSKANEALLSAEVAELNASSDTELARHLRACAECGAIAARVIAQTRRLARDRDTPSRTSSPSLSPAESRAALPSAVVQEIARTTALRASGTTWRGRRVAVAAAAVLALSVAPWAISRREQDPNAEPSPRTSSAPSTATPTQPTVRVSVPEGTNAIVFKTADPKITVVWYYPTEK